MSITDSQTVIDDYRTSIIYLDSYEDKQMCGTLCNSFYVEDVTFGSLIDLLYIIDDLANHISYPVASMEHRRFKPNSKAIIHNDQVSVKNGKKGKLGTFAVKIMFRQNATWQGIVHWIEEDIQEYFRSALEFIILLDSALDSETGA